MENCPWEEILGFVNHYEFNSFVKWLDTQIRDELAEEMLITPLFEKDGFNEKGFIHKKSQSIWRLIWSDGPIYTSSFRRLENKSKCPWNEINSNRIKRNNKTFCAFKNFEDLRDFSIWLESQVNAGRAEKVIENEIGEKQYLHRYSNTLWQLVPPDGPMHPYFAEIKNLKREEEIR